MIKISSEIKLNKGQITAIALSVDWYLKKSKQVFELTGPAGSGKTTIIMEMVKKIGLDIRTEVLFMAYIGQATLVLRRKDLYAKTIHSSIYETDEVPKLDDNKMPIIDKFGNVVTVMRFKKRNVIDDMVRLIVVDEASMVPPSIKEDLLSFGIMIIAVGDLNQLPPVMGNPAFLQNPDVTLTEVTRQAKGDPIVALSEMARTGKDIPLGKYGPRCYVIEEHQLTDKMILLADIIICGRNATRTKFNKYIRRNILKYETDLPVMGDKVLCRKNNWNIELDGINLVNGLSGIITSPIDYSAISTNTFNIDFRPQFMNNTFKNITCDYEYFMDVYNNQKKDHYMSKANKFEYAYAITCHSSQGSQYDSVIVYEELLNKEYHSNWLYTAITRAVKFLIVVKAKNYY